MERVGASKLTSDHEAEGLAEGIVPLVPLFGSDPCPNVRIVHELAEGSWLEDFGFRWQGHIRFVVKGLS